MKICIKKILLSFLSVGSLIQLTSCNNHKPIPEPVISYTITPTTYSNVDNTVNWTAKKLSDGTEISSVSGTQILTQNITNFDVTFEDTDVHSYSVNWTYTSPSPEPVDYEQFIFDRTFSIGCGCDELSVTGSGEHIFSHGTGWILKDATPENDDDYSYYMATNCHVCEYMYDEKDNSTSYHLIMDDYFEYTDSSLGYTYNEIEHGTGKFALYPGSTTTEPTGLPTSDYKTAYTVDENTSNSIDFRILKVDFGTPSTSVSTKLNRVNEYCQNNDSWAVTFANQYTGSDCYIGGYPYQTDASTKPTWEFHDVATYSKTTSFGTHDVPGTASYTIYNNTGQYTDNSPQIVLPSVSYDNTGGYNWMNHGASGSMCINGNCEVVGIYWGGWTDNSIFYPTLSVMNDSTYKNFISLVP